MNKIVRLLRAGFQDSLVVGSGTSPVIPAGETVSFEVEVGFNKVLLKSIEVTASKQIAFRTEFFEETAHLNSRYSSGQVTKEVYDVLDLPYIDNEKQGKMYFLIENLSDVDDTFSVEIRGVELR